MTPTERKMLDDTITNVLGLTKVVSVMNKNLQEAEKQITALRSEVLGMQLRSRGNAQNH